MEPSAHEELDRVTKGEIKYQELQRIYEHKVQGCILLQHLSPKTMQRNSYVTTPPQDSFVKKIQ